MSAGQLDAGGGVFRLSLIDDLAKPLANSLTGAVSTTYKATQLIDNELQKVSASIVSTGKTILAMGAAATTFGTASTVGFGKSINAAGDFAETVNMFEAVFKDQSDAVREWGKDYGDVVKRSEAQMLNFLAQSQDTFIPLGFDRNEAADFSKTVTRLAIDLGSFKNIDDGDALRRLLGGLVGNTENLKAFGVQANQAAIKAQALEMGFDPKNLTSYQKAQAILAITIAGTQDAQGDAARTANEYNNSVKGLNASALQLSITIGASLKGAATLGVQGLTSLLNTANDLLERFPILTKLVAAGTIAITAMGAAIVGTAASLFLLSGSIGSIGTFALVSLVRANGVMGTYRIATDLAMSAASRLSTAVGGNAVAMTQAATSGLSLKGRLMLIGASAKKRRRKDFWDVRRRRAAK